MHCKNTHSHSWPSCSMFDVVLVWCRYTFPFCSCDLHRNLALRRFDSHLMLWAPGSNNYEVTTQFLLSFSEKLSDKSWSAVRYSIRITMSNPRSCSRNYYKNLRWIFWLCVPHAEVCGSPKEPQWRVRTWRLGVGLVYCYVDRLYGVLSNIFKTKMCRSNTTRKET